MDTVKPVENRKALGRGLAALLENSNPAPQPEVAPVTQAALDPFSAVTQKIISAGIPEKVVKKEIAGLTQLFVEIEKVKPNPAQPRRHFEPVRLQELADSIREQGVIQPISVKKLADGTYQIVAGERRWRASQIAGLTKIPAVLREQESANLDHDLASLVENIQREDLNPLELAQAYDRLLKTNHFTQDTLSKKLGVSRVSVANTLRLLRLPGGIQSLLVERRLSEGHCRAILSLQSEEQMQVFAEEISQKQLSVREAEAMVREALNPSKASAPASGSTMNQASAEDSKFEPLSAELRELFGTKVVIRGNDKKGTVEIYYTGADSLNRILHQLRGTRA